MTREQIEKAAKKYVSRHSNAFKPETRLEKEIVNAFFQPLIRVFVDGAQWHINSVWHDMEKEVPQVYGKYENEIAPSIPCLVRGYLSTGYGYGVRYWNVSYEVWDDEEADDYECDKDKIEEWAYLDDLLPERKEETK